MVRWKTTTQGGNIVACWTNRSAGIGVSLKEPIGSDCHILSYRPYMDEASLFNENRDQTPRFRKYALKMTAK